MSASPSYVLKDFIDECSANPGNVFLWPGAQKDARKDFNLITAGQVTGFLSSLNEQEYRFLNTSLLRINKDSASPIDIDAYEIMTLRKKCYLAFYFNKKTQRWTIKSFKLSTDTFDAISFAFENAIINKGR